ncbi:MAG: response regulator transcription factor [Methylomicrobium sp.]
MTTIVDMHNVDLSETSVRTVMLIDDQALYREMLAEMIMKQDHLDVIAEVSFKQNPLDLALNLKPDLIIADPCMNREENIPSVFRIAQHCSNSHFLLIASPCATSYYLDFIKAGVAGIVLKTQNSSVLLKAVDRVLANELWFDRTIFKGSGVPEIAPSNLSDAHENFGLSRLSRREQQVVNLVGKGHNTSLIAHSLHISEKTVRNHIYSIYRKLEVNDRLELAFFATRNGSTREPRN